jgi:predicted lactoylglutathione lyase
MILVRGFFQSFNDRPIGDPVATVSAATSIMLDSREAVDATLADGIAAGGSEAHPATDLGFMYQRQLTDPDGHVLEFGYMDAVAAEQGSQVFMNQQA